MVSTGPKFSPCVYYDICAKNLLNFTLSYFTIWLWTFTSARKPICSRKKVLLNVEQMKDVYIVQCLMETDLYKLLKTQVSHHLDMRNF